MFLFKVTRDFNFPIYAVVDPLTDNGACASNTVPRTYCVHWYTFSGVYWLVTLRVELPLMLVPSIYSFPQVLFPGRSRLKRLRVMGSMRTGRLMGRFRADLMLSMIESGRG